MLKQQLLFDEGKKEPHKSRAYRSEGMDDGQGGVTSRAHGKNMGAAGMHSSRTCELGVVIVFYMFRGPRGSAEKRDETRGARLLSASLDSVCTGAM
jgi:hypothetical protein